MPRRPKSEEGEVRAENAYLLRAWKKYHADELAAALVGLHRNVMGRLMAQLKDLKSARELVAFIEAQDWCAVDAHTRFIALHQINQAIMRLRERLGQNPIDDALPGEPLRAFQLIRKVISVTSFPLSRGGHDPVAIPGNVEASACYEK